MGIGTKLFYIVNNKRNYSYSLDVNRAALKKKKQVIKTGHKIVFLTWPLQKGRQKHHCLLSLLYNALVVYQGHSAVCQGSSQHWDSQQLSSPESSVTKGNNSTVQCSGCIPRPLNCM